MLPKIRLSRIKYVLWYMKHWAGHELFDLNGRRRIGYVRLIHCLALDIILVRVCAESAGI